MGRRAVVGIALVLVGIGATLAAWPSGDEAVAQSVSDPVVFAAGDIACGSDSSGGSCQQLQTSNLFAGASPAAVLPLGDVQYEKGQLSNFQSHYHPTWGRAKGVTRPAIGNHELNDPAGQGTGYWDYYNGVGIQNGPAGERGKGYYSFDLGAWHLIALNSNCSQASCGAGGTQEKWLRADLAAHPNRCTLAYMHHPRWTSDTRDFDKPALDPLIRALYDHRVDLLLVGHSHFYERFAPQDPNQVHDPANGTRHFIVGTGGRNVYGFGAIEPNSEVRNGDTFGVLRLDLHPQGYDWRFLPIAGKTFTDSGSTGCHRTTADTSAPTAPTGLAAAAFGSNAVKLSWSPSTDEGTGVARYRVYRDDVQIGSATSVSFTDGTAQPNTTYRYHVVAEDGGGNLSPKSGSATVTTPPPNEVITATPTDDAHIQSGLPTTNAGAATALEVDRSPVMDTLLKFDLAGIGTRTVVDAKLRLYATDASTFGGAFFKAASNAWSEATVTWNTAPATSGAQLASLGGVSVGAWYEVDVTQAVTGGGPVSLRVNSSSSDGADYSSSEGASGFAPQLRVSLADTGAPDTSITAGPSDPTNATGASFSFTSSDAGARFECRRDGASWAACTSPTSYAGLADGSHSFEVRALDAANNADPTPASRTWTIDAVAPAVSLASPANGTTTGDATPALSGAAGTAPRDAATVTAKVYSGTTASGTPVRTLSATVSGGAWSVDASPGLADGTYTARAEQADSAGNTGTSASSTFTVAPNSLGPAVTLTSPAHGSATTDATPLAGGVAGTEIDDLPTVTAKVYSGTTATGTPVRTLTAIPVAGSWSVETSPALPDGTYTAQAEQSDAAGNVGVSSANTFSVTTPAAAEVLSFIPSHDTYVRSDQPSASFGSATTVHVDNSPVKHMLLKFPIAGIGARSVVSAKLRLYNTDSGARGGDFRRVASSSWSESTVTYDTVPAHDATITASLGGVQIGRWYEVDLTPLVQADGTLSMKATSTSTDGADWSSTEGPAGFAPELRVTVQ